MVRWHHWLDSITNLLEFEDTSGAGDGQGNLACCSPWGHKELNMSEQLYWMETSPSHQDVIRIIRWQNLVLLGSKAEKAMAAHSSTLAWKIPWTEEPGRLQSMGSLWVRHDWAASLSHFSSTHWRREWQPTPAFLPGESQGRENLVGCCLWGCTESDTTEAT